MADLTVHKLFYKTESEASREITVTLLEFIKKNKKVIAAMGIELKLNPIREALLKDARIVDSLRERKITKLPALVTPNKVHLGLAAIIAAYEANINKFTSRKKAEPEESLHDYIYGQLKNKSDRDEEDGVGEGSQGSVDMMSRHRDMLQKRDSRNKKSTRARSDVVREVFGSADDQVGQSGRADLVSEQTADRGRSDNVEPIQDDRNDNMSDVIDRMSTTRGGDNEPTDPKDDYMEKMFWNNRGTGTD